MDKLLSTTQTDFNLEEVHRVAVACEAAKNYTRLNDKSTDHSFKIFGKKPSIKQDPGKDQDNHFEDHMTLSGAEKNQISSGIWKMCSLWSRYAP